MSVQARNGAGRLARKVLLIGWDAADWKHITPLLDQGLMPTLEGLINGGVMGNLATLEPVLSPMLWNSIATGKRPHKHGILGFTEPDPQTGGIRPVTSTSRKCKAIWNILMQRGLRSHVVGWFAGHPAEPINGVCVSPMFSMATAPFDKPWPLPDGAVHPPSLRDTLAELRLHPGELTEAELLPFIPRAAEIDQEKDIRLAMLAKILAENCSVHNAATWILENQEWDFLGVYYDGIDHFSHGFMQFHPPRMEHVPEDKFEIYKEVITGAYRFHDMLLDRLIKLAGPETTVLLVSDHGFHCDHLRPRAIPKQPAGPAVWHRNLGIFCMRGPHVKKDERVYGATLLDVTPTILTLFGLPVGDDMDGKVLLQTLDQPVPVQHIPSWEDEPGECGMHPADMRMDPQAAMAVLEQFVALGYIQPPGENQAKAAAVSLRELNYNLARAYMDARMPSEALPLFQELVRNEPGQARFVQHLAQCYLHLGRRQEARELLEQLIQNREPGPWTDLLLGTILLKEDESSRALEHLLRAEKANPRMPTLHLYIGTAYQRQRLWADAERAFLKALEIDEDSADARLGLASVRLRQRRYEEALTESLAAVSVQHFLPVGHYILGVALARLGQLQRAILALETAVAMQPGFLIGHRWLSTLYNRPGGDPLKAAQHRVRVKEMRRLRREQ